MSDITATQVTAWLARCQRGCTYRSYAHTKQHAEWGMQLHYNTMHWEPLPEAHPSHDDNYVVYN